MATITQLLITNMALYRMGEKRITATTDTSNPAVIAAEIFDQCIDEALTAGPENGWKFAQCRKAAVSVSETSITAFANYGGTVTGTVKVTSASHGLATGDRVTIEDTTHYDEDYTVTYIDANSFYITATWAGDDATGTARWYSEDYDYRYAIPASPVCLRITSVAVDGTELTDWKREGSYILTNEEADEVDVKYIKRVSDLTTFPPHFVKVVVYTLAVELAFTLSQNEALSERLQLYLDEKIMPKAVTMDEKEQYVQEDSSSWTDIGRTMDTIE